MLYRGLKPAHLHLRSTAYQSFKIIIGKRVSGTLDKWKKVIKRIRIWMKRLKEQKELKIGAVQIF